MYLVQNVEMFCLLVSKGRFYFVHFIDAHELKIQGRGQLRFCLGGQGLPDKIAKGSPILGLIAFLLTSFLRICLGVVCYAPSPSPPSVFIYGPELENTDGGK
jgi:hypothetical protein